MVPEEGIEPPTFGLQISGRVIRRYFCKLPKARNTQKNGLLSNFDVSAVSPGFPAFAYRVLTGAGTDAEQEDN